MTARLFLTVGLLATALLDEAEVFAFLSLLTLTTAWVIEIRSDRDTRAVPPVRSGVAIAAIAGSLWIAREPLGTSGVVAFVIANLVHTWLTRADTQIDATAAALRATLSPLPAVEVVLTDAGPDVVGTTRILVDRAGLDVAQVADALRQLPTPVGAIGGGDRAADLLIALGRVGARGYARLG